MSVLLQSGLRKTGFLRGYVMTSSTGPGTARQEAGTAEGQSQDKGVSQMA